MQTLAKFLMGRDRIFSQTLKFMQTLAKYLMGRDRNFANTLIFMQTGKILEWEQIKILVIH